MFLHRTYRHLISWIAALAVLLGALAPSVSQALGAGPVMWVGEVCSARDKVTSADDESPAKSQTADEHCVYCSFHAEALGVPPSPPRALLVPNLADVVPLAFLAAPRTLHAWVRAQPRAPPLFS